MELFNFVAAAPQFFSIVPKKYYCCCNQYVYILHL